MTIPISVSLSPMDPQPAQQTSGESAVAVSGARIAALYRAFQELRELTRHLNGLSPAEPFPEHVVIEKVIVNYSVNGLGRSATIRDVKYIGDIAQLLARETEQLVEDIRLECVNAQTAATAIEEACKRSQYSSRAQTAGGPK